MAFVDTPTGYFASWAEDGTDITVPIASLPQLDAAEADGTTGDIREIVRAFLEQVYTVYSALATADKSARFDITKATTLVSGTLRNTYTVRFDLTPTALNVKAE